jgi:PIN domain nuclease of toxin-antitoxin system
VSFWEAAVLVDRDRVQLDRPTEVWRQELLRSGLIEVPLDGRIAIAAIGLPGPHSDPADLFIVATAIHIGATLVTADQKLLDWTGSLRRLDARA